MSEQWLDDALRRAQLLSQGSAVLGEEVTVVKSSFPSYTQLVRVFARLRRGEKGVKVAFNLRHKSVRLGGLAADGVSIRLIIDDWVRGYSVDPASLTINEVVGDFVFVGREYWHDTSDYSNSYGVVIHTITKRGDELSYSRS